MYCVHTNLSVLQINLVGHDQEWEVSGIKRLNMSKKLLKPTVQGVEGGGGGDVEH